MLLLSTGMPSSSQLPLPLPLPEPLPADTDMHLWCQSLGLDISSSVSLLTTPRSVAGRGVFATKEISMGDSIASIPTYLIFHPRNAAGCFPQIHQQLVDHNMDKTSQQQQDDEHDEESPKKQLDLPENLKRRLSTWKRNQRKKAIEEGELPWQVELTEYALAALREDHPFAPWIAQWQRDDPVHHLFAANENSPLSLSLSTTTTTTTYDDDDDDDEEDLRLVLQQLEEAVSQTVDQILEPDMGVPEMNRYKLRTAINLSLEQFREYQNYYINPNDPLVAEMYSTLSSRTVGVPLMGEENDDDDDDDDGSTITAVIPFHDMINHSFQPNIVLNFDAVAQDDTDQEEKRKIVELVATRDISAGEELFLCYLPADVDNDKKDDSDDAGVVTEDLAVWALVQWGIPIKDFVVVDDDDDDVREIE